MVDIDHGRFDRVSGKGVSLWRRVQCGEREFQLASEFGMRTGLTTRKGLIQRRHASALTALPRVSLNGDHQHPRYFRVFLNGAPFAFANRRQRQAAQTAPFH